MLLLFSLEEFGQTQALEGLEKGTMHFQLWKLATKPMVSLLALGVLGLFPMTASADLCGVTINTSWSGQTPVSEDPNFTACSTSSSYTGNRASAEGDLFTYTVQALDDDTFGFSASVTDINSGSAFTGFVDLVLTDITWSGASGTITNVIDNILSPGAGDLNELISFTPNSVTLRFFAGTTGCGSFGCTVNQNLGTIDIVAQHDPIPEPSTMLLFGTGLAGLIGWRWKNRKTA